MECVVHRPRYGNHWNATWLFGICVSALACDMSSKLLMPSILTLAVCMEFLSEIMIPSLSNHLLGIGYSYNTFHFFCLHIFHYSSQVPSLAEIIGNGVPSASTRLILGNEACHVSNCNANGLLQICVFYGMWYFLAGKIPNGLHIASTRRRSKWLNVIYTSDSQSSPNFIGFKTDDFTFLSDHEYISLYLVKRVS